MPQIAIICSTIPERHDLLLRSIKTWNTSIKAWQETKSPDSLYNAGIYIWSEGCPIHELVAKLPTLETPINVAGQEARSGSPELGSNYWVKEIEQSAMYIFTHPEIMFGTGVVKDVDDNAWKNIYVTFRPFWMPQYLTDHFESYGFEKPEDMEACDDLYQFGPSDTPSRYLNIGIRDSKNWESDTTWAGNYDAIHDLFPVPVFGSWGPIDPYLYGARQRLGHTKVVPDSCVYHQAHPRIEGGPPGHAVGEATRELNKRFGS